MSHIQIPDQDLTDRYTVGSTPTDTFAYSHKFINTTDVAVYNMNSLVDPADYVITGTPNASGVGYDGASVVLDTPVTDTTITLTLEAPNKRQTDFPDNGPFNISQLNTELDQMILLLQQLKQLSDRSIGLPISSSIADLTLPNPAAGALIGWNTSADGLTTFTLDAETIIVMQDDPPDETLYQLWYETDVGVLKYWNEATSSWVDPSSYVNQAASYSEDSMICGYEIAAVDGDKIIMLKAPWPFEVVDLVGVNNSGTHNVTIKIDATAITGITNATISSTESSHTASANNTGTAGQDIVMTISSASSAESFSWRLSIKRTGA